MLVPHLWQMSYKCNIRCSQHGKLDELYVELSVLSLQFFCKYKTLLNKKFIYIKKKTPLCGPKIFNRAQGPWVCTLWFMHWQFYVSWWHSLIRTGYIICGGPFSKITKNFKMATANIKPSMGHFWGQVLCDHTGSMSGKPTVSDTQHGPNRAIQLVVTLAR